MAKRFLLEEEGFKDVRYTTLNLHSEKNPRVARGEINMTANFAAPVVRAIDEGLPIVALAGVHVGCYELFARDGINSIAELAGKTIVVSSTTATSAEYEWVWSLFAYIGMASSVKLVSRPRNQVYRDLQDGTVDAVLAIPPVSQELRSYRIGHSIFNSIEDPPFSQYYCCLIITGREFLEKNPVATRRSLRAILKGVDLCAREPASVARYLVDYGFTANFDFALDAMQKIRYGHWREWEPEDAIRHYALGLRESGVINSTPEEILRKGTDWRYLKSLRAELAYFPTQSERSAFALGCGPLAPVEG